MPCCILRVSAKDFDVDAFLAESSFQPCAVWHVGEKTPLDSKVRRDSGFNIEVEGTEDLDLDGQVERAMVFLQEHAGDLTRLLSFSGADGAVLDFGVPNRDFPAQFMHLPAKLVQAAGRLGLALEVSLYVISDDDEEATCGLAP